VQKLFGTPDTNKPGDESYGPSESEESSSDGATQESAEDASQESAQDATQEIAEDATQESDEGEDAEE
jgi:hypothetical protein